MGSEHDATAGRVCWLDRWRVRLCLELGRESAWRVVLSEFSLLTMLVLSAGLMDRDYFPGGIFDTSG